MWGYSNASLQYGNALPMSSLSLENMNLMKAQGSLPIFGRNQLRNETLCFPSCGRHLLLIDDDIHFYVVLFLKLEVSKAYKTGSSYVVSTLKVFSFRVSSYIQHSFICSFIQQSLIPAYVQS